jgi:hypothetical protein
MKWIQRLALSWRFTRVHRWAKDVPWEADDAAELKRFLSGRAGRRLSAHLSNTVIEQNARAVASKGCLQTECGYANGFAGLVRVIEMMAEAGSVAGQGDDPASGTIE